MIRRAASVALLALLGCWLSTGHAGAQAAPLCGVERVTRPAAVTINTIPATANFTVLIDGRRYTTDSSGTVKTKVVKTCLIGGEIVVPEKLITESPTRRLRFARFFGGTDQVYTATFNDERAVTVGYQDPNGAVVRPSRVERTELRSSIGERRSLRGSESTWLQGARVITDFGSLKVRPVYWTTEKVVVDGLNVANRSELKFFPTEQPAPVARLLLFPVDIQVRDSIVGLTAGDTIKIRDPNGHARSYELDPDGKLSLKAMARGQYDMTVEGGVVRLVIPASITRAQQVDLQVLSYLDVTIIGGTLLGMAALMVWTGSRIRARRVIEVRTSPNPTGEPGDHEAETDELVPIP